MNAGFGVVLDVDDGKLVVMEPGYSGLNLRLDPRKLVASDLNGDGGDDLIIGVNSGTARVLSVTWPEPSK